MALTKVSRGLLSTSIVDNGNATAITIDSSEQVGIGTSSPSHELTVGDANAETTIGVAGNRSQFGFKSDLAVVQGGSGKGIQFNVNNNTFGSGEAMRIDSSGNVGINNSSPSAYGKFVVDGTGNILNVNATSGSALLQLYEGGSGRFGIQTLDGSAGAKFTTAGSERMRIDSSGNVGIGVTPESWNTYKTLQIGNGAIANYAPTHDMRVVSNAYYNSGWKYAESDGACLYLQDGDNSAHVWSVAASGTADAALTWSEAMRIDSSGNLLVGGTDTFPHDNSGTSGTAIGASGYLSIARSGGISGYFNRMTDDGDIIQFRQAGGPVGSIGTLSSALTIGTGDTGIQFNADNNAVMPHNITTGANVDASIDIGYSSGGTNRRFKDLYLSGTVNLGTKITATGVTTSVNAWKSTSNSTSSSKHMLFANPNGNVGDIRTNGSATAYITSSDYRLKQNVVPISGATERLKQLKPSRFNFIADPNTTVDGFLAHEVQNIVPEATAGEKDAMMDEEYEVTPAVLDDDGNVVTEAVMGTRSVPDYQGIDQSKLVPLLVATIQELEARIAALESN